MKRAIEINLTGGAFNIQHIRNMPNKGTANAAGYKVGDEVYIKDYKTPYDPFKRRQKSSEWTAVSGLITNTTKNFVDVEIESAGDKKQQIVRKKNENVFKVYKGDGGKRQAS